MDQFITRLQVCLLHTVLLGLKNVSADESSARCAEEHLCIGFSLPNEDGLVLQSAQFNSVSLPINPSHESTILIPHYFEHFGKLESACLCSAQTSSAHIQSPGRPCQTHTFDAINSAFFCFINISKDSKQNIKACTEASLRKRRHWTLSLTADDTYSRCKLMSI